MNGQTMKLLSEYIAEQRRKDRERYAQTYSSIYKKDNKKIEQTTKKDNNK